MTLSPKDIKKRLDDQKAAEKLKLDEENKIKLAAKKAEAALKRLEAAEKKELFQILIKPMLESAIEGQNSYDFVNTDLSNFEQHLNNGGFEIYDYGNLSLFDLNESDELSYLSKRENLSTDFIEPETNQLIDHIFELINSLEEDYEYFSPAEENFYSKLIKLDFSLSANYQYVIDKVDALQNLVDLLNSEKNLKISKAGKNLSTIIRKIPLIESIIDKNNGVDKNVNVINVAWESPSNKSVKPKFEFFRSTVFYWIAENKYIFQSIANEVEKSIKNNETNCSIIIEEFREGFSTTQMPEGIYLGEIELGISFTDLNEILEVFGYKTTITKSKNLENSNDNLIYQYKLTLSWKN